MNVRNRISILLIFILCFLQMQNVFAGREINFVSLSDSSGFFQPSTSPNKSRTRLLNYTTLGMYPLSMTWLYAQWYKDYPRSKFHFFNDNSEWEQMDKFGHAWDAYSIAKPLSRCYQWAGYSNKKSSLYSSGIAFLYQATIEVFDGFSSEWGFSPGDLVCNTLGISVFLAQQLTWEEQRITLKYSFHQTKYSSYRPDVLGSNLPENILKDYNGLTYWISVNPRSFMNTTSSFPRWLSLGIGYGAEGMTGGEENPTSVDGKAIPSFDRYRQYYLGIDFELNRIRWKSRFLKSLFSVINIVHLPAPAIEFRPGKKTLFHALYF